MCEITQTWKTKNAETLLSFGIYKLCGIELKMEN